MQRFLPGDNVLVVGGGKRLGKQGIIVARNDASGLYNVRFGTAVSKNFDFNNLQHEGAELAKQDNENTHDTHELEVYVKSKPVRRKQNANLKWVSKNKFRDLEHHILSHSNQAHIWSYWKKGKWYVP